MYKRFFELSENPFNVNPDPRYLFLTHQTREALDELTYGIRARKGLIVLTGEVGTGKTTLLNRLLEWLHMQKEPTAFIFNSHLETSHLFDFILTDFGVPPDQGVKENSLMRLNLWLIERYRAGQTPVLIVDEAQGLPTHVLEEIRMLLNLETPHQKLLQIVLAGQPELDERLRRAELRQLKQRIMLRCRTAVLTQEETHEYVQARLNTAGANGKPIFAPDALDAVHLFSRGIPRVVNLLCEHGLINAYADNVRPVTADIIEDIAREFQFDDINPIAGPLDSGDAPRKKLIAMQSTLETALAHSPTVTELFGPNQIEAPMTNDSDSFTSPEFLRGPGGDSTNLDGEDAQAAATEVSESSPGVGRIAEQQLLSAHVLHVVESKENLKSPGASSRPAYVHCADGWSAKKSIRIRSRHKPLYVYAASLRRRIVSWRDRCVSAVTSVDWPLIKADLLLRANRLMQPGQAMHRELRVWLNRRSSMTAPGGRTRVKLPVYRWLRTPWTANFWILSGSRFFAARRKLTQKKV